MDDLTRRAISQLSEMESYKVVYDNYILPELKKIIIIDDDLNLDVPDSDFKVEILARKKSFETLSKIFDTINFANPITVENVKMNQMI